MKSPVGIRDARFSDVPAVAKLESEAFPAPWRAAFFDGELRASQRYCRVAIDAADELVGYVFSMWYFDEMHINKIAVCDDARRHGIATVLMNDCIAYAREKGVRTVSLEVRESNAQAQAFYRKLNFVQVYKRPNYYPDGEDAVVMMAGIL